MKVSSHDSNGAYAVMETCVPPMIGPPLHLHQRQDEWWYILDGNFLFDVGGNTLYAGPGDTVFAPRGNPPYLPEHRDSPGENTGHRSARWSRYFDGDGKRVKKCSNAGCPSFSYWRMLPVVLKTKRSSVPPSAKRRTILQTMLSLRRCLFCRFKER